MPSTSAAQQRLFGAALAIKRGKGKPKGAAGRIAKTVGERAIIDFAKARKSKG